MTKGDESALRASLYSHCHGFTVLYFPVLYHLISSIFAISLFIVLQFSSVTQSYMTLCNPMDCSMPGFPVHHQLPELAQTHVHQVSDAIQSSHLISSSVVPFSSCLQSFPASESFPMSQFFTAGDQVLEFQL